MSETCCDISTNLHTLAVAFICHTTDCKGLNMAYHLWCPDLVGVLHAKWGICRSPPFGILPLHCSSALPAVFSSVVSLDLAAINLKHPHCYWLVKPEKMWKGLKRYHQQPLPWRDCWSAAKSSSFFLIPAEPPPNSGFHWGTPTGYSPRCYLMLRLVFSCPMNVGNDTMVLLVTGKLNR